MVLVVKYESSPAHFENICFKVILFYAGSLKIYAGNLGTIIDAKLCHALFRGLILAMLIELLQFPNVRAQSFFPVPGTLGLVLNMGIGQGSRSRYTFEKHAFNQRHAS